MTKFFKKAKKKPILGPFWALFAQILAKKWIFLEKRALSIFKYSYYLPLCQKSEKNSRVNF